MSNGGWFLAGVVAGCGLAWGIAFVRLWFDMRQLRRDGARLAAEAKKARATALGALNEEILARFLQLGVIEQTARKHGYYFADKDKS